MTTDEFVLPVIDFTGYLNPKTDEEKQRVIAEVRDACAKYGFFAVKGHGVPLKSQQELIQSIGKLFALPKEEKMKLSYMKNPCRRGYEASGDSMRDGDALPDSKEAFYIGREEANVEPPGFHGPNLWPDLPEDEFRTPVWDYYQKTSTLGSVIWEILLQGLGYSPSMLEVFAKRPMVPMKMIRYPPGNATQPGQFGVGPHTDFGGVTVLLQQPGKVGLEVWYEPKEEWLPVPAEEDVYVINCGNMIQTWSGGRYKSAKHRVINKGDTERLSCATFWHGDVDATNPLNPEDPNKDTIGQLLFKRFSNQFTLPKEMASTTTAVH
ncbi:MAG: hypothetical protein L6R41_006221 [Letrouitia leprolyta]|nr:MAG: hypothetical protein L6R41_006221 [Letrouitia leprolyta]